MRGLEVDCVQGTDKGIMNEGHVTCDVDGWIGKLEGLVLMELGKGEGVDSTDLVFPGVSSSWNG